MPRNPSAPIQCARCPGCVWTSYTSARGAASSREVVKGGMLALMVFSGWLILQHPHLHGLALDARGAQALAHVGGDGTLDRDIRGELVDVDPAHLLLAAAQAL